MEDKTKTPTFAAENERIEDMCTYNIAIDDTLLERVKPAFADNAAINAWMQSQVEMLLWQMVADMPSKVSSPIKLSQRLRGIAHAPAEFDYKKELANRY